jgi:hypothetical protein
MDIIYWAIIISVVLDIILLMVFRKAQVWFKFKIFALTLKIGDEINEIKRMLNERKSDRKSDSESPEELRLRAENPVKK